MATGRLACVPGRSQPSGHARVDRRDQSGAIRDHCDSQRPPQPLPHRQGPLRDQRSGAGRTHLARAAVHVPRTLFPRVRPGGTIQCRRRNNRAFASPQRCGTQSTDASGHGLTPRFYPQSILRFRWTDFDLSGHIMAESKAASHLPSGLQDHHGLVRTWVRRTSAAPTLVQERTRVRLFYREMELRFAPAASSLG
jgi:hypothetical protein